MWDAADVGVGALASWALGALASVTGLQPIFHSRTWRSGLSKGCPGQSEVGKRCGNKVVEDGEERDRGSLEDRETGLCGQPGWKLGLVSAVARDSAAVTVTSVQLGICVGRKQTNVALQRPAVEPQAAAQMTLLSRMEPHVNAKPVVSARGAHPHTGSAHTFLDLKQFI